MRTSQPLSVHIRGWLLLLPAAVLLVAFTHYPTVATFIRSLYSNGNAIIPQRFVGLGNYDNMLHDPIFWQALTNNVLYAVGTVPVIIGVSMLMAIWVNRHIPGRALARMAYFTPTVLPMIAVADIWMFFYAPGLGLIDQFLGWLGFDGHNWLGDPDTALVSVMVLSVWKDAGFFMVFYLAALQSISPDLKEAANLEGASRWYIFRRITFPLLMPTTIFVLINALIRAFRIVDQLFIMTHGGPNNATTLLLYYIYEVAFSFVNTSYAATLTVVLIVGLALAAVAQFYFLDRRAYYR